MSLGALDTTPCTLAAASQILWEAPPGWPWKPSHWGNSSSGLLPLPGSCASAWGYRGTGLWNTQLKGGAHSSCSCQQIFAHVAQFSWKVTCECCSWINNTVTLCKCRKPSNSFIKDTSEMKHLSCIIVFQSNWHDYLRLCSKSYLPGKIPVPHFVVLVSGPALDYRNAEFPWICL